MMTNKEKADKLIIHNQNPQMATFEELVNISESIKEVVKGIEAIETIEGVQGEQGIPGAKGDKGDRGEKGDKGEQGIQGPKGLDGKDGLNGTNGINGKDGLKGDKGDKGDKGQDGKDGANGSPDSPKDIKDKLETLKDDNRLDISAIKGTDNFQDRIVKHSVDQARGLLYAGLLENQSTGGGGTGSASPLTNHNLLSGLQGGTAGEYYHLTSAEYTGLSGLTASEVVITDGSGNLASAAVSTYPSLTELSYVKGVTSAIQTQLNTKIDAIGDTVTSGTTGAILHVGAGPVLAQTGATVYLSSDNLYFDQTGTGANQDTKGLYFKPTYSDGTVRTTFGVYTKAVGIDTYPEMIIGSTNPAHARIRIRSLDGAGESIYFNCAELNFSNVSGSIAMPTLKIAAAAEFPHTTERFFVRHTGDYIAAGFEVAHYGSNPQEIVYIHNNPWTGASSGGAMYTIRLRSDTTDWNLAANWTATWATATHASRKGRATFNVYDTAIREAIRIEASGSAPMVGFYGTAAVVQAANTTDLGTVLSDVGLRASGTAYPITTSGAVSFTGTIGLGGQITISDAIDIALNTTTGTKIGTATNQKLGFYNKAPVVQPTALTTQLTSITHTAPGTPDYAIQDLVDSSGGAAFGFATKDEGNTVLSVILNLQTRVSELETKLQSLGLLA